MRKKNQELTFINEQVQKEYEHSLILYHLYIFKF